MDCFVYIFALFLATEGRDIQRNTLAVNKKSCVEDAYQTIYGIPSLMQCASLCLNADICQSVTFLKMTGECRFSNTTSNTTCTLGDGDGTITSLWFKTCPTGEAFCNLAAEVYYEFVQSSVSWEQAQQDCVNRGGQLAVLDTERKFSWMQELRMAQQTDSLIYTSFYWIGLRDAVGDHSWTWLNGAPASLSPSVWFAGEPNHSQGDNRFCALALPATVTQLTQWSDKECIEARTYICEFSI